jgi:uncharacterized membrane protein YedE/YeeE
LSPFDPTSALIGGALIGLAAVLLMLLTGRIAGISGILGGGLSAATGDRAWRFAFLAGLVAAPLLAAAAGHPMPMPAMPGSWWLIAAGGLLVGFGSRLGSGCTSGHGVCGLSRRSTRSLAATAVFFVTAMIVVFVMRHVLGGPA